MLTFLKIFTNLITQNKFPKPIPINLMIITVFKFPVDQRKPPSIGNG